jgi:uncharacterized protein
MKIVSIILVSLLGSGTFAASAASFDCAKASSRMEKAICSNAELSALDDQLGAEYNSSRKTLGPAASKQFVAGQVSWLRYVQSRCFTTNEGTNESAAAARQCLVDQYKKRLSDFGKSGKTLGGFNSWVMVDYAFRQKAGMVLDLERRFPQVDDASPLGVKVNRFLGYNDKAADRDDYSGFYSEDVTARQVTRDLLMRNANIFVFVGAHPTDERKCRYYSVRPEQPIFQAKTAA